MSKFKLGDKVVLKVGVYLFLKTITYVHYNAEGQFEYELNNNVIDRFSEDKLFRVHINPKHIRLENFGVALLCKSTNRVIFNTITPIKIMRTFDWRFDEKSYDLMVIDYD